MTRTHLQLMLIGIGLLLACSNSVMAKPENPRPSPDIKSTINIFGDSGTCDPSSGLISNCMIIFGTRLHDDGDVEVRLGDDPTPLILLSTNAEETMIVVEIPSPQPNARNRANTC